MESSGAPAALCRTARIAQNCGSCSLGQAILEEWRGCGVNVPGKGRMAGARGSSVKGPHVSVGRQWKSRVEKRA